MPGSLTHRVGPRHPKPECNEIGRESNCQNLPEVFAEGFVGAKKYDRGALVDRTDE